MVIADDSADILRGLSFTLVQKRGLVQGVWMNLSPKLHSLLAKSKAYNFHLQTLKRPVAFSVVHFDIKPQIVICNLIFYLFH